MFRFSLLFFICLSINSAILAQSDVDRQLSFYSDAMVNCVQMENRVSAHETFYSMFKAELEKENSFEKDLSFLKTVSVQLAADTSFRMISWQLFSSENEYSYYAFLQKNNGEYFEWKDEKEIIEDLEYETITPSYWYGALYYNLEKYAEGGDVFYLLYGYSKFDKYTHGKVLDVLHFDGGKPVLGKDIFVTLKGETRPDVKKRLVLNYSADTGISLNYNPEMNLIIFDHLIAQRGRMPGQGMAFYSDGSYEGYEWKDGKWIYKEKIFDQVLEEAPRPKPVLGENQKGLFGQEKKKRGN